MILEYRLQFFAEGEGGEKTEEPTAKKLSDARKEGQVAKSKEIANCTGLLAVFLVLRFAAGWMGKNFLQTFFAIYNRISDTVVFTNGYMPTENIWMLFKFSVNRIMSIMLPLMLIGFTIAFLSDLVQVKWKPTTKPLKPKFSKLNPVSGFKKIFSANSLVELLKSIAKIAVVILVSYNYIMGIGGIVFNFYDMEMYTALQLLCNHITNLGIRISAVFAIVAAADFAYQKFKFHKDMKMTKQEVKDEYKQSEGDPEVKGKIKQKMMEVSRRRMMQALPQADVVITNPTHYAVAIKYDPKVADAPLVIAKGEGYLAARIKEVAKEHHIEIVENKPLARMIYHNVEIGEAVPPELYQAVAEVLAFVYHLQGKI